jgi:hypothetical protein
LSWAVGCCCWLGLLLAQLLLLLSDLVLLVLVLLLVLHSVNRCGALAALGGLQGHYPTATAGKAARLDTLLLVPGIILC